MKAYLFFINLFTIFLIISLYGKNLTIEEENFITSHYPPKDIVKKLDAIFNHLPKELDLLLSGKYPQKPKKKIIQILKQEGFTVHNLWFNKCIPNLFTQKRRATLTHKDLPNYFLKIGFDEKRPLLTLGRVVVADLVYEIVKKYDLSEFGTMEKKIYHRPHQPSDLNDFNYIVLSPRISGHQLIKKEYEETFNKLITSHNFIFLKSVFNRTLDKNNNPIITLNKNGNPVVILDFHKLNFITNDNKTFFIIDTEPIFEITTPPFSQNLREFKDKILQYSSMKYFYPL